MKNGNESKENKDSRKKNNHNNESLSKSKNGEISSEKGDIESNNNKQNISFITNKNKIDISILKNILPENSNHGVCGSINLGNTCFMNSSIACLSNCIELTIFFLSKEYLNYINNSNQNGLEGKLAFAWYRLLKDYWKTDKKHGNPSELISLIAQKNKKYANLEQQDANEFISLFLGLLNEELNVIKDDKYQELKEKQPNESDLECAKRFWEMHLMRNNSIISELFCGLNKSTIICSNCGYESITYNPFNSISLLIPNNKQLLKLKDNNCNKIDINSLYYIPKYSLAKTQKLKIRVNKEFSFQDILLHINDIVKQFPFEIKNFNVISVTQKELVKDLDINDKYKAEENVYNFAIEKDIHKEKNMIFIPVYIKIGNKYSAFPRGLYIYEHMNYKTMKKKIYLLARKYFHSLIDKKSEIDKKIFRLNENYDKKEEKSLIQLIKEEYDEILKTMKKNPKLILPYKILIQKNIDSNESLIIFDGKEDILENLERYEISKKDNAIDLLALELINLNNILVINIDTESQFYRKSISEKIDICNIVESEDFGKNDPIDLETITLDDCFRFFNDEEYLDDGNKWFCSSCKNHVNASKKLEFFYLPKILFICISRFRKKNNDYKKNEKYVQFPIENLNMNKYLAFKNENNYIYDLFAVCQHYGGTSRGHYTAVCKNYDEKWYTYDDSNVSPSSEKEICTNAAYILFYKRKD
jgi:ubiquitin carboxyl-terminal hydrolase 4/11/15